MVKKANEYLLWWAFLLFVVICFIVSFKAAAPMGDGVEYILSALSFYEKLSPFITQSTLEIYSSYYSFDIVSQFQQWFATATPLTGQVSIKNGFLFLQNGDILTWHFWAYSLLVAPFLLLSNLLGLAPHFAFMFCNWFFIALVIYYINNHWQATELQKKTLACLYFLGGTTYYLWWTHPEVLTASLLLFSLLLIKDKHFKSSYALLSIAAMQNPPLIFLLMFYMLYELYIKFILERKFELLAFVSFAITRACFGLFAISPMLFYYSQIGVMNPIVSGGSSHTNLISIDRLASFYFDLNQGMAVAIPCIIAYLCLTFYTEIKHYFLSKTDVASFAGLKIILLAVLVSTILAIPALSTTNWNHGHTVFSRYAYWLSIPILFGLVVSLDKLRQNKKPIAYTLVAIQFVTVVYYGVFGKTWNAHYLRFNDLSKVVLTHFPNSYNPVPEIFAERASKADYFQKDHAYYFIPDGASEPSKILVSNDRRQEFIQRYPNFKVVNTSENMIYLNRN